MTASRANTALLSGAPEDGPASSGSTPPLPLTFNDTLTI
jgi:hypothetical protein